MAAARTKGAKNKKSTIHDGSLGGFTIIEVVLVLAIAGLIFLMVFIALPQLQRAQRDTQRRQDMADLQAAVSQYQTNNNGKIPGQGSHEKMSFDGVESLDGVRCNKNDACRLIVTYMNPANATTNTFVDPDGTPYSLVINDSVKTDYPYGEHTIYMYTGAGCDGEEVVQDSSKNPRDFALVYRLEGSGVYCHSNNS